VTWFGIVFSAGQPVGTNNPLILAKAAHNADFVVGGAPPVKRRRSGQAQADAGPATGCTPADAPDA
jgi:hypothetical protein